MQTSGAALLAIERSSLARVRMPAQYSRSAHGLLYFAAVRDDRHHLIRSDLQPCPLPAHLRSDLLKYSPTMRSEQQG